MILIWRNFMNNIEIEKINKRQICITTKRNDVFIPDFDFDYIIEVFKSVFPLQNPKNNLIETSFDICGHMPIILLFTEIYKTIKFLLHTLLILCKIVICCISKCFFNGGSFVNKKNNIRLSNLRS
mgnify:CR=1 FL=1